FLGLGDNTSRKQVGVTLKHQQQECHGYKFTFLKTNDMRSYAGDVNGIWSYAVAKARVHVEPVGHALQSPRTMLPQDLPTGPSQSAVEALLVRGILSC